MKSRGNGLDKEDNMAIDGAILTTDSHGDKFQCNRRSKQLNLGLPRFQFPVLEYRE